MDRIGAILNSTGLLAEHLTGYRHRPQQQAMAEAVAAALAAGDTLICEAGTGTGKTFAYLVPVLLSGRKVLISTGTRNLQDQLFQRDLPLVRAVLKAPVRIAMLKGRSNYLCRYRLDTALQDHRNRFAELRRQLSVVRQWATVTHSGDVAELDLPEDAPVWPAVTSNSDNCLGQECPNWGRCHLVEARRRAQEADLVVVNHHLLCADLSLRDEGFGEVLPGADCFIVDEAHQLPEVASSCFGLAVSGRQLLDLTRDLELAYRREAGDMPELPYRTAELRRGVRDLRLYLGEESRRGPWRDLAEDPDTLQALEQVHTRLHDLCLVLTPLRGRGKGLDSCIARSAEFEQNLTRLTEDEASEDIRWYETLGQGFRLHRTPLQVADIFQSYWERHPAARVFTSATLAVGERFDHFARQLGIEEARTERWESPFDYGRQALWFVPRDMPDPGTQDYGTAVVEVAVPILEYSRGRAFLLFTSHRALRATAQVLESRVSYPLLVQGSAPRAELLERFRHLGNAVLLGTASFWEGVDVRGEALSCVIIDKLPFASPEDPVLAARIKALRHRGGNPFRDFQLPQAVIALKQGAGRLIRDDRDRGVLVVCDPRLLSRSYGRAFLDSLPPMLRSRDLQEVRRFFAEDTE